MPRHSSLPTLYDECKTISLTALKKWGYLVQGQWKSGTIKWSRNGVQTSSIGIIVNMCDSNPHVELNYKYNDEPVNYKIPLLPGPSNLGKGVVWYFSCPKTGKRCRKLYLISTYFLHRAAFSGCFYEKQTYSHRNRDLFRAFESLSSIDKAYETLHTKYFKSNYAGKPTKRYSKLIKIITSSEQINVREIEEMIYKK